MAARVYRCVSKSDNRVSHAIEWTVDYSDNRAKGLWELRSNPLDATPRCAYALMPRPRLSQRIVNWLLPAVLIYMACYAVWSIIRPFTGY